MSWQDYTYAKKDTLKRFWDHYEYEPKMLVSGLGHKYKDSTWRERIWEDLRVGGKCNFNFVEWNLCSCPFQGLKEIGGFIEEMDFMGFGMDGYSVNERLSELGYQFYCDSKIESFSLGHGRVEDWDKKNLLFKWKVTKNTLEQMGLWPIAHYI